MKSSAQHAGSATVSMQLLPALNGNVNRAEYSRLVGQQVVVMAGTLETKNGHRGAKTSVEVRWLEDPDPASRKKSYRICLEFLENSPPLAVLKAS